MTKHEKMVEKCRNELYAGRKMLPVKKLTRDKQFDVVKDYLESGHWIDAEKAEELGVHRLSNYINFGRHGSYKDKKGRPGKPMRIVTFFDRDKKMCVYCLYEYAPRLCSGKVGCV